MPGSPLDARAGGCNQLIRDGATLVRSAEDVADALASTLGAPAPARAARPSTHLATRRFPADALAARLLDLLGPSPVTEDALIRNVAQPAAAVSAALVDLELAGRLIRHPGGLVSLSV